MVLIVNLDEFLRYASIDMRIVGQTRQGAFAHRIASSEPFDLTTITKAALTAGSSSSDERLWGFKLMMVMSIIMMIMRRHMITCMGCYGTSVSTRDVRCGNSPSEHRKYFSVMDFDLVNQVNEKTVRLEDAEATIALLKRGSEKLKSMNEELLRDQKLLHDKLQETSLKLKTVTEEQTAQANYTREERATLEQIIEKKNLEIASLKSSSTPSEDPRTLRLKVTEEVENIYTQKINQLEAKASAEKNKALDSQRHLESVRIELSQKDASIEAAVRAKEELHSAEIIRLSAKLHAAEESLRQKEDAAASSLKLRDKLFEYSTKIKEFNREMQQVKNEHIEVVTDLNRQVDAAKTAALNASRALTESEAENSILKAARQMLESELRKYSEQESRFSEKIENLEKNAVEKNQRMKEQVDGLKIEISEKSDKIRKLENNLEISTQRLNSADAAAAAKVREAEAAMAQEAAALRERAATAEARAAAIIAAEISKSQVTAQLAEARLEKITALEERISREFPEMKNALASVEREKLDLSKRLAVAESEAASFKENLHEHETLRRDYATLQARLKDILTQVSLWRERAGSADTEKRQIADHAEAAAREATLTHARLAAEAEAAKAEKARLLEKSKSKIKQIKETVEILGAKLDSVQKEKCAVEQIAVQNKRKFEERLLEFERRALLAAMPKSTETPALSN